MRKTFALMAGLAVLTLAPAPAQAQVTDTVVGGCVFSYGAINCVRQYRYGAPPQFKEPSPEDLAESRERERQWVDRCRPRLVPDSHGVGRYVYAARGCEYGRHVD